MTTRHEDPFGTRAPEEQQNSLSPPTGGLGVVASPRIVDMSGMGTR